MTAAEQIANAIATVLKAQEEKDLADANVLGAQKKEEVAYAAQGGFHKDIRLHTAWRYIDDQLAQDTLRIMQEAKVPLYVFIGAMDTLLRKKNNKEHILDLDKFIKKIIQGMYAKITDYEQDYASDECELSREQQREPCWCIKRQCWKTYVAEKVEVWREDYPFLDLRQLTESTKHKLKTCTLGQFVTVAGFVEDWKVADVKNMQVFSDRLAEHL